MTNILTSIIILFSIVAYGQTTIKEKALQTISDWKTLNQTSYSIQYPKTWELNQSGQMGTSFILFSALEKMKYQIFFLNTIY